MKNPRLVKRFMVLNKIFKNNKITFGIVLAAFPNLSRADFDGK